MIGVVLGAVFLALQAGPWPLIWSGSAFLVGLASLVLMAPGRARVKSIPAERVETRSVETVAVAEPEVEAAEEPVGESAAAAQAHRAAQRAAAEQRERARVLAKARAQARESARAAATSGGLVAEAAPASTSVRKASPAVTSTGDASMLNVSAKRDVAAKGETDAARSVPAAPTRAKREREVDPALEAIRHMGVVGDTSEGSLDLDAVLRRRRVS